MTVEVTTPMPNMPHIARRRRSSGSTNAIAAGTYDGSTTRANVRYTHIITRPSSVLTASSRLHHTNISLNWCIANSAGSEPSRISRGCATWRTVSTATAPIATLATRSTSADRHIAGAVPLDRADQPVRVAFRVGHPTGTVTQTWGWCPRRRCFGVGSVACDGSDRFVGVPAAGERGGCVVAGGLAGLDRFQQMDRDVGHAHLFLLDPGALHAIVEHDVAERTRGRDPAGAGGDRLGGALVVDLGPGVLLHPHAGTTGAAAHALGAVAGHLDHVDALDRRHHLARREVHVVVATEIARVVVGDALFERGVGDIELARVD